MVNVWQELWQEVLRDHTLWIVGGFILLGLSVRAMDQAERMRLKGLGILIVLHLVLLLPVALVRRPGEAQPASYVDTRLACWIFAALAAIGILTTFLFAVVAPALRLRVPRILRDVVGAAASIVALFSLASRSGFNLSGLIATSAVLTAVIGLSLQSTLGNVMAGLSVQLDNSVRVGDWVKVHDLVGKVVEIRWRSTSIETRNWETVVVPNSVLTTNHVLVLGRRIGQPVKWRRWVWFNVDFRYPPDDVIATVTEALQSAPIERVAQDPPPNCVLMDLADSSGRYAVRYWLTDLAHDDPTDSAVRNRIYFALRRAGIPLSLPAHSIFLTEESTERKAGKEQRELERRLEALAHIDFFDTISPTDRARLAASLRHAPFARGEVMTRQGAEAHWLYLITSGEASVHITVEGIDREVARLGDGTFFGEMSLMTGEPRSATVIAETNVDCYRLDKSAFQDIIRERPELAEKIAEILARRRVELAAVRENLDAAARERRIAATRNDLASRIRSFFGISEARMGTGSGS